MTATQRQYPTAANDRPATTSTGRLLTAVADRDLLAAERHYARLHQQRARFTPQQRAAWDATRAECKRRGIFGD